MSDVPQVTTFGAVIDGLVTAFAAIASDDDYGTLRVWDGPDLSGQQVRNGLAVGVGDESVDGEWIDQYRGGAVSEGYDIQCLTWAWSGDTSMKKHRDRCVTVLAAVRDVIIAQPLDPTAKLRLGGPFRLTQTAAGEGKSAALQFTIHAVASI